MSEPEKKFDTAVRVLLELACLLDDEGRSLMCMAKSGDEAMDNMQRAEKIRNDAAQLREAAKILTETKADKEGI